MALAALLAVAGAGCDLAYPEVSVTNRTAPGVRLKDPAWNGCRWEGLLDYGRSTPAKRCLPGEDHVHVSMEGPADPLHPDGSLAWYPWRTVDAPGAGYQDSRRFEVVLEDLEQDFEVPGPYGH